MRFYILGLITGITLTVLAETYYLTYVLYIHKEQICFGDKP